MSTFRFNQIRADVNRIGPSEDTPGADTYAVRFENPEGEWLETRVSIKAVPRTAGLDFSMAVDRLVSLLETARMPVHYRMKIRRQGGVSEEEITETIEIAKRLRPYLEDALTDAQNKMSFYEDSEGFPHMDGRSRGRRKH